MKTKTAIYIGQRITTANKLAYFWEFEDGARGYKKLYAPASIGEIWEFSYDDEGRIFIRGEHGPKQTGNWADSSKISAWTAESVAAKHADAQRKMNLKLKNRADEFNEALDPIKRMLTTLRTHSERAHFISRIVEELWRVK